MADEDMDEDIQDNEDGVAEGEDGDGAEGDGEKKGNKKILIIAIAGVVLLVGALGAGLYFAGVLDGMLGKDVATEDAHGEEGGDDHGDGGHGDEEAKGGDHGGGHGEAAESAFVVVPTMNISLNTDDGVARYLRLSVQLELKHPEDAPAVEAVMPRVIDRFQTYLRELRVKDLRGSGGIYRLQMELLWRVNQAAAPVEVKDVLFQEILVQ